MKAPRLKASFKGFLFMIACTLIVLKILLFLAYHDNSRDHDDDERNHLDMKPPLESSSSSSSSSASEIFTNGTSTNTYDDVVRILDEKQQPATSTIELATHVDGSDQGDNSVEENSSPPWDSAAGGEPRMANTSQVVVHAQSQLSAGTPKLSNGKLVNDKEVFHDRDIFMEEYNQMNKSFKIYIYPHKKNDPFANVLLPANDEPGGNYASESYFKIALSRSHFITKDPSEADLFFLPFSIAGMRNDKRIGVGGIQGFVRDYISRISHEYPYWNRTGGADHFYVACHSIGKVAMEKAPEVRLNAIQVVCSSNYFLQGYTAHKDASIPQIWPRQGVPPNRSPLKREKLAFYAGAMNSKVREYLVRTWIHDSEISVHQSRLKTSYSESQLGSKFCIHAKGFEVNTARIGDAIYYGCVPVVLADHYDLPFADILNWSSFSVVLSTGDIPSLKKILKEMVDSGEYLELQKNVLKVRNHFQWHRLPVEFDAFYMVLYELWLRRGSVRIHSFDSFTLDQSSRKF